MEQRVSNSVTADSVTTSLSEEGSGEVGGGGNGSGGGSPEAPQQQDGLFKCKFCDRSFQKHQALGGHMNAHQEARDREKLERLHERLCQPRANGSPLEPLYPGVFSAQNGSHHGPASEPPPYHTPAQISVGYSQGPIAVGHFRESPLSSTYTNAYSGAVPYFVPYRQTPLVDNSIRNPSALAQAALEPVASARDYDAENGFLFASPLYQTGEMDIQDFFNGNLDIGGPIPSFDPTSV